MSSVLSQTYGRPGGPGSVEVLYLNGLEKGSSITVTVGEPGKGGPGGPPNSEVDASLISDFVDRGGAGGGRENLPIIEAFLNHAECLKDIDKQPLCLLDPGKHELIWPYDTSTVTLVMINPGGGGGGGIGEVLPGEDGEDGLPGAAFLFPTYLPVQRPRENLVS